ncbi:hypothetical protein [Agromyces soli]|uniref:Uncharacterized protein n=1 Tax=Agromyces soli TaxID=659012 RepID=A0ABY4AP57_9MICO|nr:hypothetical protein [Agromyces soli]UOE24909.1 hypothetical protein MTP13_11110 [Agromyces soli]
MSAERWLRGALLLLPDGLRPRYREEWLGSLRDAEELDVPRAAIVRGAYRTALGTPRTPAAFALAPAELGLRRLRWAAAWFAAALVLMNGGWLIPGELLPAPLASVLSTGLAALALAAAAFGALSATIGLRTLLPVRRAWLGWLLAAGIALAGAAVVLVLLGVFALGFGLLLGFVAGLGVTVIAVAWPIARDPALRRTVPGIPARLGVRRSALLAAATLLAALVVAVLHLVVWNPMAKVPGLELREIYAELAARGEFPAVGVGFALVWAASWAPLVLVLLAVATFGNRGPLRNLDERRVARTALAGLAALGFGVFVAGFSLGMSLADAFMTSGGDAAVSGPVLTAAATVAGVAACLRIIPHTTAPVEAAAG